MIYNELLTFFYKDEGDVMLDKVCTDVLYRIPLTNKFSDWEHSLQHLDPIADYRQRYPNIHFHVSIPDSFLMTTSSTEMARLVAYLVKMQAGSLDVILSRDTDLGVLFHVLLSYKNILPPGKQLSISISEARDPTDLVLFGIIDSVDRVYAFPSYLKENPFHRPPVRISIRDFASKLIEIGIPNSKLVIGVPSTIISVDNPLVDPSTIPTTYNSLCSSVTFTEWIPRRSSTREDGYDWENPHEKWKLRTRMGLSITNDIEYLHRMKIYGIGVFDLAFKRPVNPICSWHKDNFIQSVYQAINPQFSYNQQSATNEDLVLSPRWRMIGGRLGRILVFAQQQDEDSYVNYFNITDDNTLMASPLDHIVLGYNDDGHVYNIYKPSCQPYHAKPEDNNFIDSLNYLVDRYSLETLIRHATVHGSLLPPSILIFPEPLPINSPTGSIGAVLHPQIMPKLITWFKIRRHYQDRQDQQNYRTKRMSNQPYGMEINNIAYDTSVLYVEPNEVLKRPYNWGNRQKETSKRSNRTSERSNGRTGRSFMLDRPFELPEEIEEIHERIRPYACYNLYTPVRLGSSVSPRETYPEEISVNDTESPAETLEHPPALLESVDEDLNSSESTHTPYQDDFFQFGPIFDMFSSLNDTYEAISSQVENDLYSNNSDPIGPSDSTPENNQGEFDLLFYLFTTSWGL